MSEHRLALVAISLALLACKAPASSDDADTSASESSSSSTSETSESGTTETSATETGTETGTGEPPRPDRLLVSADWRAKRISLLDYASLRDGAATRDEALWKTIELDAYEPGPLEAELSPDGSLIIAAISPGFFAGAAGGLAGAGPGTVPEGGVLLIIEVDSGEVLAELDTAQYPMGIAFTEDGSAAWTANYGGNGQSGSTVSHIDLASMTIVDEYEVGPGPEQIAISGSLAIVNTAGDGSIRLFDIGDPAGTLSSSLATSSDSSGVLHLPSGQQAAVINSIGPPGYSLIDTSDTLAPALVETIEIVGIPYAGAHGLLDGQIVLSSIAGTKVAIQMFDTATGELLTTVDVPFVGFPLGLAVDANDELAFVPIPGANKLAIANLGTGEQRSIDWQDVPGPTYVSLEP